MRTKDGIPFVIKKVGSQSKVYSYEVKNEDHDHEEVMLVVTSQWGDAHREEIRRFFISYAAGSQSESRDVLGRLNQAGTELQDIDVSFVALVVNGKTIYAVGGRQTEIWLVRKNKANKLFRADRELRSLSGWIQGGDVVVGAVEAPAPLVGADIEKLVIKNDRELKIQGAAVHFDRQTGYEFYPLQSNTNLQNNDEDSKKVSSPTAPEWQPPRPVVVQQNLQYKWDRWRQIYLSWATKVKLMMLAVLQAIATRLPTEESIYAVETRVAAQESRVRSKRVIMGIALILLFGLIVSIGLGIKQRRQAEWEEKFGSLLEQAQHKLGEGENLASLNPQRARDLATEAEGLLAALESRGLAPEQLGSLKNKVRSVLGLASGTRDVEVKTWLSLGLVREKMEGSDMDLFTDKLGVLDNNEDRLVLIGLDDKSAQVVAGKEMIGEGYQAATYGNKVYVVGSKGVTEVGEETKVVIEADNEWGEVKDMSVFGGNLYLLTSTGIWKYPVIESGYGGKQAWLDSEVESVVDAQSMIIDGFVWVAGGDRIRKFVQGSEDPFVIRDVPEAISEITALYLNEDSDWVYILEAGQNRVVVIEKDTGVYKQQYVSPELANASSLIVREENKQMLFLAKDRLLEIELDQRI